jgi:hypothetical protein
MIKQYLPNNNEKRYSAILPNFSELNRPLYKVMFSYTAFISYGTKKRAGKESVKEIQIEQEAWSLGVRRWEASN